MPCTIVEVEKGGEEEEVEDACMYAYCMEGKEEVDCGLWTSLAVDHAHRTRTRK